MDPIWLCVTTLLLHLLINRLFGRLRGWLRVIHWPAMQLAAMAAHTIASSAPIYWLLQWSSPLTGVTCSNADLLVSCLAAMTAALIIRGKVRLSSVWPPAGSIK